MKTAVLKLATGLDLPEARQLSERWVTVAAFANDPESVHKAAHDGPIDIVDSAGRVVGVLSVPGAIDTPPGTRWLLPRDIETLRDLAAEHDEPRYVTCTDAVVLNRVVERLKGPEPSEPVDQRNAMHALQLALDLSSDATWTDILEATARARDAEVDGAAAPEKPARVALQRIVDWFDAKQNNLNGTMAEARAVLARASEPAYAGPWALRHATNPNGEVLIDQGQTYPYPNGRFYWLSRFQSERLGKTRALFSVKGPSTVEGSARWVQARVGGVVVRVRPVGGGGGR